MKEGYLRMALIPTFLAGMIRDLGQRRAGKGLRSGGYIFYLSALLLFRVPSPRNLVTQRVSIVLRKNLGVVSWCKW